MPLKMPVRVPILGVSKTRFWSPPVRYLFKRKGSDNWYVRLQPPGQKIVEKSLGTSDL